MVDGPYAVDPTDPDRVTTFTLTARYTDPGMLVSISATGKHADATFARRFYSVAETPPDSITPADFWAPILMSTGAFLARGDDDAPDGTEVSR